jgi:hypothetical protein
MANAALFREQNTAIEHWFTFARLYAKLAASTLLINAIFYRPEGRFPYAYRGFCDYRV